MTASPLAAAALTAVLAVMAALAVAILAAPLAGLWWRRRGHEGTPMAWLVFGLVVGLACAAAGAALLLATAQFWARSQPVQGVLVGFAQGSYVDSKLRREVATRSPQIEFAAADGTRQRMLGAVGSLSGRAVGSAVALRVDPGPPPRAVVAEPAALWGAPVAITALGLLALALAARQARALRRAVGLKPPSK